MLHPFPSVVTPITLELNGAAGLMRRRLSAVSGIVSLKASGKTRSRFVLAETSSTRAEQAKPHRAPSSNESDAW